MIAGVSLSVKPLVVLAQAGHKDEEIASMAYECLQHLSTEVTITMVMSDHDRTVIATSRRIMRL